MPTVEFVLANLAWLAAMLALTAFSAYCSGTEAVLFSLKASDRKLLAAGSEWQRTAVSLLEDPDRLLAAILFWNLLTNLSYFAISSLVTIQLEAADEGVQPASVLFGLGSVLWLILLGEMLPKCVGVLGARSLAPAVAAPMVVLVRAVAPIVPVLSTITLLSQRVIWPSFEHEPYLEVEDLQRVVEVSSDDAQLIEQEQLVLRNLVQLSELRADELMRPRTQYVAYQPPVRLSDLQGRLPRSGYLLVTESGTDEIAAALDLRRLSHVPRGRLDAHADPVVYVPWCATAASVWESLRAADRAVAAVVNEFGETIGVLTREDLFDRLLAHESSRSERLQGRRPLVETQPGVWQVIGLTSLSRLERHFQRELPPTKSLTVAGVLQEVLQRWPAVGDACEWGPFRFRVLDAPDRGTLLVELALSVAEESQS